MNDLVAGLIAVYVEHRKKPGWRLCTCARCVEGAKDVLRAGHTDPLVLAYAKGVLEALAG